MSSETASLISFFVVSANGGRLSSELEGLIEEIEIVQRVDGPSSFKLRISDPNRDLASKSEFSIGSEIKIKIGTSSEQVELINAKVTVLIPEFKMNSDDYIIVKGYDAMHQLYKGKKTKSFSNMSESEIAQQIISDNGMQADVSSFGNKNDFTFQKDMTDYDYLMSLAKTYNCNMWCKDQKIFIKPIEGNSEDAIVEWGKTLVDFRPKLQTNRLFTEVEVRGWDPDQYSEINAKKGISDITLKVGGSKVGLKDIEDNFGASTMIIVDENINDVSSAEKLALNVMTEMSLDYITGSGSCQGNNKILAGSILEIKELGEPFSGKYFVKTATHKLNAYQGYMTYFDVRRNAVN